MTLPLPPNATIGIIGGGQLGRYAAMAAARLGYRTRVFSSEPQSPATQVATTVTIADYEDLTALTSFAEHVDVVTFEFENISATGLNRLAALKPVRPAPEILCISQDRLAEKSFLNRISVATAPWAAIHNEEDLDAALSTVGLPAILKTTRLGYDGKGQALLRSAAEARTAYSVLAPHPLILEGFVDFAAELSVILARGADGSLSIFDTVENRHRNHILDLTLAPAPIAPEYAQAAHATAERIACELDLVGLLAIEFFLDRNGRIIANEIAPRPHNSGHWTLDACPESQFDLMIRAVAGLPLPPAIRHADAVMKNLVGPDDIALWPQILATPGLIGHHYGKIDVRPGRKLGHVNRLFPKGALPGEFGLAAALAPIPLK